MSTPIIDHYVALHSFYRYGGQFPPVRDMKEAVGLVTAHRIKAEIIGQWLYCYAIFPRFAGAEEICKLNMQFNCILIVYFFMLGFSKLQPESRISSSSFMTSFY